MSCCAGDLYEELAVSLLAMIKSNGPSGFGYGSTAEDVTAGLALNGKVVSPNGMQFRPRA
jgi:hypothetical protein